MSRGKVKHRLLFYTAGALLVVAALVYFFLGPLLSAAGRFLVVDDGPIHSEAVVVLSTGIEYYPRLMEAASLFREGYAEKVVINGNRKSAALRELERKGFVSCCQWYEDSLRILSLLGVPRDKIITVSAEDAYDTVSESKLVGQDLIKTGITRIMIITSKYHTRRAGHIWENSFPNQFSIRTVGARTDPFSSSGWWKEGRQIRWVLSEYGAWIYYYWKTRLQLDG